MDNIHEERIDLYRTGLLARLSHPCTGRHDKAWDIEAEFSQTRQDYRNFLGELLVSEKDDFSQHTLLALLEELDWAVTAIESAWIAQDKAILNSREEHAQRLSKRDPQRRLDSFSSD